MAVASQFSLEEENFYKDIQDLVKKGSQNEKELSSFLERYMDLLARSDLDDETFIINFTKAALIIEASAKVYGTKVDRLWINLERVLESLKVKGQQQTRKKGDDDEEGEDVEGEAAAENGETQKKLPNQRRRKKVGEALSSPDDFMDIDIISSLGKSMNETKENADNNIKFYEKIPNLFIKNKPERRRIDVCLIKTSDDRDDSRLRDWIISLDNMLVKEMYVSETNNDNSVFNYTAIDESFRGDNNLEISFSGPDMDDVEENRLPQLTINQNFVSLVVTEEPPQEPPQMDVIEEANNNENIPDLDLSASAMKDASDKDQLNSQDNDQVTEIANVSEEIDLRREGEANLRRLEDNLIDVNDVFWNSTKFQDVIPSRKLRAGRTVGKPCQLCVDKKRHKKKGKKCVEDEGIENLDTYFSPHVQPVVSDPLYGYLPDEELLNAYKMEMKLIEQLGKAASCKNINEAYHPNESPEEVKNFLGFDGFDNYLLTKKPDFEDDDLSEALLPDNLDDDNDPVDGGDDGNKDFDVPFPVTETNIPNIPCRDLTSIEVKDAESLFEKSRLEYQRIVIQETQGANSAKSCFERNKELGMKISRWHSSLVDKIKSSQERGALNMNVLANTIMNKFPQPKNGEKPVLTFRDLVKTQSRKDVPRYFLACLQLTNEGNIDIHKLSSSRLAVDCMALTKLRSTRVRQEFDEYDPHNTSERRNPKSPAASSPAKRKRPLSTCVFSDSEDETVKPKKKTKNQKREKKSRKRRSSSSSDQSVSKSKKKYKEA